MKKRWVHRVENLAKDWNLADFTRRQGKQGILVACSGGVDSVALFHLLRTPAKKAGLCLGLIHVNYGLRGEESQGDEDFVHGLARQYGAPCFVHRIDKEEPRPNNTQAWARQVRYKFFSRLAENGWLIALAHHSDDLAETFLLRASRGAGVGQLAGMKEWTPPHYWRPLLRVSKAEVSEWMSGQDLPHREDSSNAKMIYGRNRVRNIVLPGLESIHEGATRRLARLALDLQEEAEVIREWLWTWLAPDCRKASGIVLVQADRWRTLPHPLIREALSVICERGFREGVALTHEHLRGLADWLESAHEQGRTKKYEKHLPQGLEVTRGVAHTEFKLILVELI